LARPLRRSGSSRASVSMISLGRTTDRVRLVDEHIAVLRNTLLLKTRRIAKYNQHWVEILMAATAMKQELEFRLPWPARILRMGEKEANASAFCDIHFSEGRCI
jgi:hypothetical protein